MHETRVMIGVDYGINHKLFHSVIKCEKDKNPYFKRDLVIYIFLIILG